MRDASSLAQRGRSSRARAPRPLGTRSRRLHAHRPSGATGVAGDDERLVGRPRECNGAHMAQRTVRPVDPRAPVVRVRLDVDDVHRSSRRFALFGGVRPRRDRLQQELRDRQQRGERSSEGQAARHVSLSAMVWCHAGAGQPLRVFFFTARVGQRIIQGRARQSNERFCASSELSTFRSEIQPRVSEVARRPTARSPTHNVLPVR
jgi:hypothetical protein